MHVRQFRSGTRSLSLSRFLEHLDVAANDFGEAGAAALRDAAPAARELRVLDVWPEQRGDLDTVLAQHDARIRGVHAYPDH